MKNPDEATREQYPTVPLYELLASNAQSWVKYYHIVYGLKDDAPPSGPAPMNTTATPAALPNTTQHAALPMRSAAGIRALLAAGDALAGFIAWLDTDPRHLQWQDPQSGQPLLHLAAASDHVDAVQLLLARGMDRQQRDRDGHTPAELLAPSHMSSHTDATRRIAELLRR